MRKISIRVTYLVPLLAFLACGTDCFATSSIRDGISVFAVHSRHERRIARPTTSVRLLKDDFTNKVLSSSQKPASMLVRGGGVNYVPPDELSGYSKCPVSKLTRFLASFWGSAGVAMILLSSVRRLVPIALEPIKANSLSTGQLAAYVATMAYFAYAEGYKGFQTKFAPMVVARSRTLQPFQGTPFFHSILAPFFSMGLFHATKKRMITSWGVTGAVALIVGVVKRMPYPWRNIVDAGVVVGLSWGAVSILFFYLKSIFTGSVPDVDTGLP
mmetsp:Transcript_12468/g.16271  ORF Transcript_12468/g.16271 Transcript_12468/m.16271 type:complete len:271 (+) Transcript_12468:155-967(+)|eukprot:CAMPEP_0116071946 /NCGR_PEP_ID=MMETSP0322-20121206/14155_1 /TAXON_ID=163516 /ORGANISM="Leptocylindrus danicus var. apora, Strain B651" /LENGTH=270 /DNA_ID=CAMNT_0003560537 /DNA_START=155 /DNA_END=967 /DNA_ORIENTATION=-